jgi:hypothetical protein
LFLGDACETLQGRYIEKYASRKTRINNFIDFYIFKKEPSFTSSSPDEFYKWKKEMTNKVLLQYKKEDLKSTKFSLSFEELLIGLKEDLNELYDRIEQHQLPYTELYDELFNWYTHVRMTTGQQTVICGSKFHSVCPPISTGILRATSAIHPKYRITMRFFHKLFSKIEKLKDISGVPTANTPLLNKNIFPLSIQMLFWGIRSSIDQKLIKRIMKKKNPNLRYRLFKSLNWVQIYRTEKVLEKYEEYFTPNNLGNIYKKHKSKLIKRVDLKGWPLGNFDIMTVAITNLIVEQIKNNKTLS